MLCIHLNNTNPYFCLAAEEYLLKNYQDDIFMLWQSDKTIVLGKHQNALGEINYPFVRANDITVARRISGGGTVYHDYGNVNFAFFKNVKSPAEISFRDFTMPMIQCMGEMGIEAEHSGRNDILIQGKKVSGNAQHVYKNRVLHHGTLLFDSDLENLGSAIKVVSGKYTDKAVKSNRSEVANISEFLNEKISTSEFIRFLMKLFLNQSGNQELVLSNTELQVIEKQSVEKFQTWEWNYGYSPKYQFRNEKTVDGKTLSVEFDVKRGIIQECAISGDYFSTQKNDQLAEKIKGSKHEFSFIKEILNDFGFGVSDRLVYSFF